MSDNMDMKDAIKEKEENGEYNEVKKKQDDEDGKEEQTEGDEAAAAEVPVAEDKTYEVEKILNMVVVEVSNLVYFLFYNMLKLITASVFYTCMTKCVSCGLTDFLLSLQFALKEISSLPAYMNLINTMLFKT